MDLEKLKKEFSCDRCKCTGSKTIHIGETEYLVGCGECNRTGINWPAAYAALEKEKQVVVPVPDTIDFKEMVDELTVGVRMHEETIKKQEDALGRGNAIIAEKNRRIGELEQQRDALRVEMKEKNREICNLERRCTLYMAGEA